MSLLSIPISGLSPLNVITSSDFIPVVQSSSLTTFRIPLTVLGNWISSSVDASSSFSSISSSKAYSSSYAYSSSFSIVSNKLNYPNESTASYAITASFSLSMITASFPISISWASQSLWTTTASFASQSLWTTTASFASQSLWTTTASFASCSLIAISASWASQSIWATSSSFTSKSISSSYASIATTASYALGNFVKAFGTFYMTGSPYSSPNGQAAFVPFSGSYNFISAAFQGTPNQNPSSGGMVTSSLINLSPSVPINSFGSNNALCWIFYMSTPLPSVNYTIIPNIGGEQTPEWFMMINFPLAGRTTTSFSMSIVTGTENWDQRYPYNPSELDWISLMVLHP